MTLRIRFEDQNGRDLSAWNATNLSPWDGDVFVSAIMDRHGKRYLALFAGQGAGAVAVLDSVDVLQLMDAIDTACQAHGGAARRFTW